MRKLPGGARTPGSRPGLLFQTPRFCLELGACAAALSVVLTFAAPTLVGGGGGGARAGAQGKRGAVAPGREGWPTGGGVKLDPTGRGGGEGGVLKPGNSSSHWLSGPGPALPRPRPAAERLAADKGSGTALPPRGGGWGPQTLRPTVGAGVSLPILMCPHRPRFKLLLCPSQAFFLSLGKGDTQSHRSLEKCSAQQSPALSWPRSP